MIQPKNIQERTISLGLTTQKRIKRNQNIFRCLVIPLYIGSLIVSAYYINGARDFLSLFWQMATIAMAVNILDCFLIDELWVRKTNMWLINGIEDLKDEYVPLKGQIKKE